MACYRQLSKQFVNIKIYKLYDKDKKHYMQLTWMDFVSERQVVRVSSGDVLDLFALLSSVPGMQSDHTHTESQ